MTPKSERSDRNPQGVRQGRRVAQGLYIVLASAFVIISTLEVQHQVYGAPPSSTKTGPNCSYLVGAFEEAITRGVAHAALEHSREKADEAFEDIVSPSLSAVEKHCTSADDKGAFVAATRLRDAAEASVDTQQSVLAPLRAALLARKNP